MAGGRLIRHAEDRGPDRGTADRRAGSRVQDLSHPQECLCNHLLVAAAPGCFEPRAAGSSASGCNVTTCTGCSKGHNDAPEFCCECRTVKCHGILPAEYLPVLLTESWCAGQECTHAEGSCQQCAQAHKDGSNNHHREQAQAAKDPHLGPDKLSELAAVQSLYYSRNYTLLLSWTSLF